MSNLLHRRIPRRLGFIITACLLIVAGGVVYVVSDRPLRESNGGKKADYKYFVFITDHLSPRLRIYQVTEDCQIRDLILETSQSEQGYTIEIKGPSKSRGEVMDCGYSLGITHIFSPPVPLDINSISVEGKIVTIYEKGSLKQDRYIVTKTTITGGELIEIKPLEASVTKLEDSFGAIEGNRLFIPQKNLVEAHCRFASFWYYDPFYHDGKNQCTDFFQELDKIATPFLKVEKGFPALQYYLYDGDIQVLRDFVARYKDQSQYYGIGINTPTMDCGAESGCGVPNSFDPELKAVGNTVLSEPAECPVKDYDCLEQKAFFAKNPQACNTIPESAHRFKIECLVTASIAAMDEQLCAQADAFARQYQSGGASRCYAFIAKKKGDLEICDRAREPRLCRFEMREYIP